MQVLNKIKFRLSHFDTLIPGMMRGKRMSDILTDRHYQKTARALMEYTGIRYVREYPKYKEYSALLHIPFANIQRLTIPHERIKQVFYSGFVIENLNPIVTANLCGNSWPYTFLQVMVGGDLRYFLVYHDSAIIEPDENGVIKHTPHSGILLLPERFKSYFLQAGTETRFEEVSQVSKYRKWLKISKVN